MIVFAAFAALAAAIGVYCAVRPKPCPLPPKSSGTSLEVDATLGTVMRQRGVSVLIANADLRRHAINAAHNVKGVRYVACVNMSERDTGYAWLCAQLGLEHGTLLLSQMLPSPTLLFLDCGEGLASLRNCDALLQGLAEESFNFNVFRVLLLVETPEFARRVVALNGGEKFTLCA